ncbi:MAG: hypothetical protein JOZ08_01270 [Verrucomicrobia bacterium]|nr:hypothetical protein [Verrucomicrobiota bacterium]MBV8280048.1 hypothetical protein [Verrucomicrobiota bacterium]
MVAANYTYHRHLYAPDIGITQTTTTTNKAEKNQPQIHADKGDKANFNNPREFREQQSHNHKQRKLTANGRESVSSYSRQFVSIRG